MAEAKLVFIGWENFVARHEPETVLLAFNRALFTSLKKTRTQISKNIRQTYNIKARDISGTVKLKRHSFNPPEYSLVYSGYRISIRKFAGRAVLVTSGSRGARKGYSVLVRKDRGRKTIKGGFFGPGGWPVYLRKTDGTMMQNKNKAAIQKHSGLAIPQMVQTKDQLALAYDFMTKESAKQWPLAMNYYIKQAGGES